MPVWMFIVPARPKLPVSRKSSFSRYELSVECGACWMPRSSKTETLPALASRRAVARMSSSSTPQRAAYSATGTSRSTARIRSPSAACSARKSSSSRLLLHEHAEQRGQAEGVGAGAHLQVEVGELRGLRAARVDDDERARRVLGDLLQDDARAREPVRLPRVLADEHRDLGALEVGRRVAARAAEELAVDPELAGLLLRERVRHVAHAERRARGRAVGAAEVVPLPAAAVVEDRRAAVLVADRAQALGDLGDGGVPVDRLERPVGARRSGPVSRSRPFW